MTKSLTVPVFRLELLLARRFLSLHQHLPTVIHADKSGLSIPRGPTRFEPCALEVVMLL